MEIGEKTYRIQEKLTAVTIIWRNWPISSTCRKSGRMIKPPWSKWIRVSPRIQIVRSNFWDAYQFNSILHLLLWEGVINFYLPVIPSPKYTVDIHHTWGVYLLKWHTPHQIPIEFWPFGRVPFPSCWSISLQSKMEFGGTTHHVEESTKGGDHDEFNAFNGYIYIYMYDYSNQYIYICIST